MKAPLLLLSIALILAGCAAIVRSQFDSAYGVADPQRYASPAPDPGSTWQGAKQVFDHRCVLCHACYDAPCQLNLASFEGIARGESREKVYDTRLRAAEPTRLFTDAQSPAEWRKKGFAAVLNERSRDGDLQASVLYRAVRLKSEVPIPSTVATAADAPQSCPAIEEFDRFAADSPHSGMPYGLPALQASETGALVAWLEAGSPHAAPRDPPRAAMAQAARWEAFLNGDSLEAQLMSRYIYEHLFFAHLYFGDSGELHFFEMVRSRTPPGETIDLIATRRPYDDPKVPRVFYRLRPLHETLVAKTHQPYRLDDARMDKFRRWFLDPPVRVSALPSYDPETGANPFVTFHELPLRSRYRFMLEESHFTIAGFLKGPVCRGQVALGVINSRFWVVFADPDAPAFEGDADFLAQQADYLTLPSESGSNAFPLDWLGYGRAQRKFLELKMQYFGKAFEKTEGPPTLEVLWDGDRINPNAGLTIFRHFDQGSVVQGLVGAPPKTAWIIGYPLLERIHYLLVAGFDVFGNLGHQLNTRIYMDYLRMEGEANFVALLPLGSRKTVRDYWYRGARSEVQDYIDGSATRFPLETGIAFKTADPAHELMRMMRARLEPALSHKAPLTRAAPSPATRAAIERLGAVQGRSVSFLPQLSYLIVRENDGAERYFTLLHDNAHSNISHLFDEDARRLPDEDTLTVLDGLVGAYPNAFYRMSASEIDGFTEGVARMRSDADYRQLAERFAVGAAHPDFWAVSDRVIEAQARQSAVDAALPDYGRFALR
ncbi:MAG TPA: fatty acid cis/trans isomerase [Burkholderiales bacterium]|nr:fatty acid cis/trans isomerase [Burkholderiales bacterium]